MGIIFFNMILDKFHIVIILGPTCQNLQQHLFTFLVLRAFEGPGGMFNGLFNGNPFKGRTSDKALAVRIVIKILGIRRGFDRAAIDHLDDFPTAFFADRENPVCHLPGNFNGMGPFGTQCTAGGPTQMSADDICPRFQHLLCLPFVKNKGQGKQILLMGNPDGFNLIFKSQPCLFQRFPELTVNQSHRRKIDNAGKSHIPDLPDIFLRIDTGIRCIQTKEDGNIPDQRNQFPGRKISDNGIAVAKAQITGQGCPSGLAESSGTEGQNQVRTAAGTVFGTHAAAGSNRNDVLLNMDLRHEFFQDFSAIILHCHHSQPKIIRKV